MKEIREMSGIEIAKTILALLKEARQRNIVNVYEWLIENCPELKNHFYK